MGGGILQVAASSLMGRDLWEVGKGLPRGSLSFVFVCWACLLALLWLDPG